MEGLNLIDIPIYIANFVITFALLYLLLYKPVSRFLSERRERVENALEEAETMRNEAAGILGEAKAELVRTGEKARQLSHETIENAALDAERILNNAEEEAEDILERAKEQRKAEAQAALERAYTEMVSLAEGLASRILAREVTIEDNRQIAERFFSETVEKYKIGKGSRVGEKKNETPAIPDEGRRS